MYTGLYVAVRSFAGPCLFHWLAKITNFNNHEFQQQNITDISLDKKIQSERIC